MATSNDHRKVTKRSSNACLRCRRQKIKCSGQQPCSNCGRRNLTCIFDDRDNKILVTQGYLSDLQAKLARLERTPENVPGAPEARPTEKEAPNRAERRGSPDEEEQRQPATRSSPSGTRESSPRSRQADPDGGNLMNPMLEEPSKFMLSSSGRTFYLGTSSNWSFHGQILNLVHEHIHKSPLPGAELLFDGSAYELPWDGTRSLPDSSAPIIPSIDYAIFLINAVKFHCAQLVHLFDEDEFNANLHAFYSNSESGAWKGSLWYIHFLLIIAFGKSFVQHKHQPPRPPGADFFVRALQLLPDTSRLCSEPVTAVEILCCIALYFQSLDSRNAAYVTIGQAMRVALAQGMHTDMPVENLGQPLVQRCRKIWWTVYILDRQMTALMGLPQSIRDDDISCQLPNFNGSAQRAAALNMQIKLARIYADIARTVYGNKGRLRKKFVVSIKVVLDDLVSLAEELRQSFPLHADERFGGISRMPAHLHLMYYQTIVVVTRPLLFCCLRKIFESPREVQPLISSKKIRSLLHMSLEASQKILNILEGLQDQGLLETFLPWDLDSLFVSTMVLILTRFVDFSLMDNQTIWLDKAYTFLETMIASGNRIAAFRNIELRKLDEMLTEYTLNQNRPSTASPSMTGLGPTMRRTLSFPEGYHSTADLLHGEDAMAPPYNGISDEGSGFGDDLTAEQILAVAESMDIEGSDWLSFATLDNYQMVDPQM
ncbi:Zn(II)2Cys6 transcription factor [Cucurbitaria berberidis CBS 394.84]|uniref:Zn(II)2Cys6 transcription factor n=1 Tax=Cucurbitaria berberidis CBS 394.84 TaxID=1168544 RepID=A0A9P4GUB2_9PLEO|nr:Zn(II)2Cys6 transcription factor [Cucurbitaria berberidis CBS 394.84]KAF1851671.1 Zn(II)2Cys6 transcription factor [Cucurbitaria berberidis CBS 394.84]